MRRPFALRLAVAGLLLVLAGLASWRFGLDLPLHRMLRLDAGPSIARDVARLSALGGLAVMGPIAIGAVVWLTVRGRRGDALWLFATIASGRLLVEAIKLVVLRPRPPLADRLAVVTSWSFPSSHSAGTMMTALALALLAGGGRGAIAAALAVAAVIGWSRVALAVHWPGDVLAGWGFGLIWIGAALAARPVRPMSR